jgi:hypothetical protein
VLQKRNRSLQQSHTQNSRTVQPSIFRSHFHPPLSHGESQPLTKEILIRINSALVSACFVFCLSRLCKDPCLCPWKLAESRRRNVRLARCPQRPSDQNPSCCCTRLRALSLMHKPFPNLAVLRAGAVLGSSFLRSMACGLTSLAYLYLILFLPGSILQGYCNKKTLFSNPCRCASQYRSTCRLEWACFRWCN